MSYSALTNEARRSPQRSSRNGVRVDTFLIHHQASTNNLATVNMMVSGSKQVSANYCLGVGGDLWSIVDEEDRAWTSGSSSDGGKGAAWDRRSITIEVANATGAPGWTISEAQYAKLATLALDLSKRYGFDLNRDRVLGHRELYQRYGASYATACPGGIDLDRVVRDAIALRDKTTSGAHDMRLMRDTGGTIYFATAGGVAGIENPQHLGLLMRFLVQPPNAFDTFNGVERDIIISYIDRAQNDKVRFAQLTALLTKEFAEEDAEMKAAVDKVLGAVQSQEKAGAYNFTDEELAEIGASVKLDVSSVINAIKAGDSAVVAELKAAIEKIDDETLAAFSRKLA